MPKNFSKVAQYLNFFFFFLEKAVHQTIKLYGLPAGVYHTKIIKIDENIISHSIFDNNQFSKSCHRKEGVTVGGLSLAASYMAQVEQSFISRNFAAKIGTVRTI